MKKRGINMLPPNINYSQNHFIIKDGGLLYPLTSISGINEMLYTKIEEERKEHGLFTDFFDFVTRMFGYKISEVQIQKLIDSGALDCLYNSRASMNITIKAALQFAELNYSESGQLTLGLSGMPSPNMFTAYDNPLENLDKEYEALGIMLSDNPLHYKHDLLVAKGVKNIIDIQNSREEVSICGIIKTKKIIHTKKGTSMAFIKIFDETGELEATIFPNVYENCLTLLEKNNIVIIKGRFDYRNKEVSFLADQVELLED